MSVYTVHQPPPQAGASAVDADRIVFVRDRFAWGAFLLAPLWLAAKRLWLALAGYLVLVAAICGLLYVLGAGTLARVAVLVLLAVLVGLEAPTLHRWTLVRRRWKQVGVVVADDLEEAERRFFAGWAERRKTPPAAEPGPRYSAPVINPPPPEPPRPGPLRQSPPAHPVGLFPEPGGGR